jgi:hypothetical protein
MKSGADLTIRTCVAPDGRFICAVHRPSYQVENLRESDEVIRLGELDDGTAQDNRANYPQGRVVVSQDQAIFEIANPFPFKGATYIGSQWAAARARNPAAIRIPQAGNTSLFESLSAWHGSKSGDPQAFRRLVADLPKPLKLALASNSNDPLDLACLAQISADFRWDAVTGGPMSLRFERVPDGTGRPAIHDHELFEAVANNPHLPDAYKRMMVLMPGIQGASPITAEWRQPGHPSHVFEYLRCNSYIPWGHYAANMAHDAVRYTTAQLTLADIAAMRHLYYQRTVTCLARELNLSLPPQGQMLSVQHLETLRQQICTALKNPAPRHPLTFTATLWGWNFGFDYAPSGYRLHASHQQVHQQYAMIPSKAEPLSEAPAEPVPAYAAGDLIADFSARYRRHTGQAFFEAYLKAIFANQRLDRVADRPASLVVWQGKGVILFVPKAQTSQWELQLMTAAPVGHVLEADTHLRGELDKGIWVAMRLLGVLGARMITVFEYAKRLDNPDTDQRLIYAFLPRLPESPGAFSEAQLRWINGHFPEDFAAACRLKLDTVMAELESAEPA